MKTISLGYSPCPNDTFIFYGLVHRAVDTEDIVFNEILDDVETLNRKALEGALDMTKVSYHAFGHLRDKYYLLRSGGALGKGCGPLVVAREECTMEQLRDRKIAVPGLLTTAFLLLQIFDPSLKTRAVAMPFDRIIDAVESGAADAGLIIHESRFTYQRAGLKKVMDLGEWWEEETGLLIPLGGILARKDLGGALVDKIDGMLKKSIEYSFSHREETRSYIRRHARELEDDVMEQHIGLYVNDYSLDIGDLGEESVEELLRRAESRGIIGKSTY
ncbi:MAG: 1,4-dihydroxy-6-naphthoate synthase [Candidatus Sulfobium sp.]